MECDPTRMCELLVGLGEVDLVGVNDSGEGQRWRWLSVPVRPVRCVRAVAGWCGRRVIGLIAFQMLLCFANACRGVFEESVEVAGDVAF